MARRLRVGLDIDGVLVDFVSAFLKEAEEVLGRKIEGPTTTWEFEESLDMTKEEVKKIWDSIKEKHNWFLLNPKPFKDVERMLQSFVIEHEVYFITSRTKTAGATVQEQSIYYLNGLGVDIPVVLANFDKGEIAAALKLDVFLDDCVANVERVMEKSPSTKVFLRDATYNAIDRGPWLHATSFEDFVSKVEDIANE